MTKNLKTSDIQKMLDCANPQINLIETAGEDTFCIEIVTDDESTIAIQIAKRISFEDMSNMAITIADNIAVTDDDGDFDFRPYMKDYVTAVVFAKYYTDIDETDVDADMINKLFNDSEIGETIGTTIAERTRLGEIVNSANELIEYRKALYVSTQAQRVDALERQIKAFVEQMTDVADMFQNINGAYADMDDETNKKLIESVIKLGEMDKDDIAVSIYKQMQEDGGIDAE